MPKKIFFNRTYSKCGNWETHWQRYAGKPWTLGGHMTSSSFKGSYVVPVCKDCYQRIKGEKVSITGLIVSSQSC